MVAATRRSGAMRASCSGLSCPRARTRSSPCSAQAWSLGRRDHPDHQDGKRINVAARWALQKDNVGWPDAVIEIARDVTADKVAAAELREARDVAEEASQAKSEYLSRMSHELRTPLTAILGYSDLLEMREPRDDQTEAISAVQEASGHLLSLVNDVLDIARIEAGRETFSLEPVALEAIVEECVRLVAPSALSHHNKVSRSLGDCAHAYVLADRQRLVQALLNLLSNAVKYSGDGAHIFVEASREVGVERSISGGAASAVHGDWIRLAVRDTGPGPATQAHTPVACER